MHRITPLTITLITACLMIAVVTGGATPASHAQTDSGLLAIAGADGNLYIHDIGTGTQQALTSDAVRGARVYSWPTWATDGQLAYFGTSLLGDPPYRLGIFVQSLGHDPVTVYTAPDETFTYAYWAPGDAGGDTRDLAVLYTAPTGSLAVRRVRSIDQGADFSVEPIAEGGPFYWDWSPDGQSMFWTRLNQELAVYDTNSGEIVQRFEEQPGLQRAVDWSPVDDRLLSTVRTDTGTSTLTVFDGDARIALANNLDGVIAFEWSPDGSLVAYTDDDGGTLRVVDAANGDEQAVIADGVIAFFWSPDGTQIAYIAVTREGDDIAVKPAAQSTPVIRWYVYNTASGVTHRFARFFPSDDMLYYLQFFDQFARSHRLWSRDSRYLVYGERQPDGTSIISLIDTQQPGSAPESIMEGRFGVFSW